MQTKLYFLAGPNDEIRYIGKTIRSLSQRLSAHICYARKTNVNNHRANWIRAVNCNIKIELIEEVEGTGAKEEIQLIAQLRGLGYDLTNCTEGGDGVVATPDIRKKMSDSAKIRSHTPEGKEAMRQKGLKHRDPLIKQRDKERAIKQFASPEARQKMSERNRKRFETKEARINYAILCGSKPFKCIETGVVYYSLAETARELKLQSSNIRKCLTGERIQTCGKSFAYVNKE